MIFEKPQCSTGTTQSKPFPARAGNRLESAGHYRPGEQSPTTAPAAPLGGGGPEDTLSGSLRKQSQPPCIEADMQDGAPPRQKPSRNPETRTRQSSGFSSKQERPVQNRPPEFVRREGTRGFHPAVVHALDHPKGIFGRFRSVSRKARNCAKYGADDRRE